MSNDPPISIHKDELISFSLSQGNIFSIISLFILSQLLVNGRFPQGFLDPEPQIAD